MHMCMCLCMSVSGVVKLGCKNKALPGHGVHNVTRSREEIKMVWSVLNIYLYLTDLPPHKIFLLAIEIFHSHIRTYPFEY